VDEVKPVLARDLQDPDKGGFQEPGAPGERVDFRRPCVENGWELPAPVLPQPESFPLVERWERCL